MKSEDRRSGDTLITREESLLLVIDMQEKLVPAMSEPGRIVENTKRLLALARILGLPVVFTEQGKLGPTLEEIRKEAPTFEAISKMAFNCFASDMFAARVNKLERSTLIIIGIEAHICVAQTAIWAHPRFRVHVVSDAVSSRSPDNHAVALDRMRAVGITVTSTEMTIYELLREAGTEQFRAMLPYVK
jgi:nicotinamidase-related amidase